MGNQEGTRPGKLGGKSVGVAWYRRGEWEALRRISADRESLESTWAQWLAAAERRLEEARGQGIEVQQVDVSVDELAAWCQARRLDVDASARSQFVADKLRGPAEEGEREEAPARAAGDDSDDDVPTQLPLKMPDERRRAPVDEFLDAQGRPRRFRLSEEVPGVLEAVELRDGVAGGLRFSMPVRDQDPVPVPWAAMRDRIRRRLAERHVVRDGAGRLQLLHRGIRGQLGEGERPDGPPTLLVDDLELSWDELGALLSAYGGFGLRLQLCDAGEE